MYKVIEVNGKRVELTSNGATALVYKQIFRRELDKDLGECSAKEMKKITKALKNVDAYRQEKQKEAEENGTKYDEAEVERDQAVTLESEIGQSGVEKLTRLVETITRLGFVMIKQCQPFKDYWGKVTFEDYVEWRASMDNKDIQHGSWITGVINCWSDNNKTTSEEKNQ